MLALRLVRATRSWLELECGFLPADHPQVLNGQVATGVRGGVSVKPELRPSTTLTVGGVGVFFAGV